MFRFGEIARENKGIVFNLVFSFLVIVAGPFYIHEIKLIRDLDHTNFFIGFTLMLFLLAEPFALYFKIRSVYYGTHKKQDLGARVIFLWIAHIVITVQFAIVMAFAMPHPLKFVNIPLFWIIGIKEFVSLFLLVGPWGENKPDKDGNSMPKPKEISEKKVFICDVILTIFAFLAFGICWQSMGPSGFLSGTMNELADNFTFRIFAYVILFFIIYYPIRMGHFIEEWLTERTKEQKRNYRISFFITMASFIGPMFTGPDIPPADEINQKNSAGKTPLISAIEYEPIPYLRSLIEHGADLNVQDTSGYTALHYAAKGGRVKVVELLMKYHANPDLQNKSGGTALSLTAGFHHLEAMEMLLKYHANPDVPYYDGETALMEAAHQGYDPAAVELLLKYKAKASQQDTAGWCALSYFSHSNNTADEKGSKILDMLVKNTNLALRDNKGHTLVWHAMRYNGYGYTDVAKILLRAGAPWDSTDIINKDGWNQIEENFIENDSAWASRHR